MSNLNDEPGRWPRRATQIPLPAGPMAGPPYPPEPTVATPTLTPPAESPIDATLQEWAKARFPRSQPTTRRPSYAFTVSAGTAFKLGFFGSLGALAFWLLLAATPIVALIALAAFGAFSIPR